MFKLNSQIEIKILGYFFLNKEARKYVNELAEILQVDASNLDKKLKLLVKEGIFLSEAEGKQRYYYLNKNYPLLKEIERFYNLKYGLEKRLYDILVGIKGVKHAYIYGSYAQDALQQESDIDVLLVGGHSALSADNKLSELQNDIQREINIIDFDEKEFEQKKEDGNEFILEVLRNKHIKLI